MIELRASVLALNLQDVDLHRSARSALDHFEKWHQDR